MGVRVTWCTPPLCTHDSARCPGTGAPETEAGGGDRLTVTRPMRHGRGLKKADKATAMRNHGRGAQTSRGLQRDACGRPRKDRAPAR
eukprot:559332-Prymnesium_polylepis.1